MSSVKSMLTALREVQHRYGFTTSQADNLSELPSFDNIITSATYGRWDQVTLLLIQEKIIDKWPA